MRLRAVLRPEAEEHELPPAEGRRHRRRTPRQAVSAVDPAGDEHVTRIVGVLALRAGERVSNGNRGSGIAAPWATPV